MRLIMTFLTIDYILIMLTLKFILLILSMLVGYTLGYVFTETKYDLQKYPLFRFKAFACRPCLTFHICWVTATAVSLAFESWEMVAIGIAMSFGVFAGLKIDEKQRQWKE